jgi:SAM-dependent methyltransferase
VTLSARESELAGAYCDRVSVCDVEREDLPFPARSFDVLLLSHVLEHLNSPGHALTRLARWLRPGGWVLAAVPNMAFWRVRARILAGDWKRDDTGFLDRTHLHFWSYRTAHEVFEGTPFVLKRVVAGELAIPLWPLRALAPGVAHAIDDAIGGIWPNLAAGQVLMLGQLPEERA